ncbi:hypothetical protein [Kitasatospora sp. NPDC005748]|uniref:hypothetical protein n=1 Tax=Kitasatospora sp. NPDC005748 TaxID=3157063 RepID=UPI0033C463D6
MRKPSTFRVAGTWSGSFTDRATRAASSSPPGRAGWPVVGLGRPGMIVFSVVNGLAFGRFTAVDTAPVTMVLPEAEDAARDIGGLDIANACPRILVPFVASVVPGLGGRTPLFLLGAALAGLGTLALKPVRGVR